ncbi:winged helix-turn-helix transcriptional regulator [Candidatus Woesearchaeota archaeon]|nr:MAG: hypothetical protein QT09_C0004G0096 [archaeon GW2011_AR18]MBS3162052.1 winged helix-turn-helix transcriptional regulator [Candidatus Woesearchaeota archaeon]HIH25909.1 winged helix-turn-helix transcriptional regulator [Nanoarchaeota archaeon]
MIQNYNGYRVLQEFMEHPLKGYKLRELSRILKLGLPSVSKYVKELEKEGIIELQTFHGTRLYFANRESEKFKIHKIFHNRIKLLESGVIEHIQKELSYPTIILFGSRSRGDDTEKSDYDIAAFGSEIRNLNLDEYERKIKSPIQLVTFNIEEFQRLKELRPGLLLNIMEGIKLSGNSLNVFRKIHDKTFKI